MPEAKIDPANLVFDPGYLTVPRSVERVFDPRTATYYPYQTFYTIRRPENDQPIPELYPIQAPTSGVADLNGNQPWSKATEDQLMAMPELPALAKMRFYERVSPVDDKGYARPTIVIRGTPTNEAVPFDQLSGPERTYALRQAALSKRDSYYQSMLGRNMAGNFATHGQPYGAQQPDQKKDQEPVGLLGSMLNRFRETPNEWVLGFNKMRLANELPAALTPPTSLPSSNNEDKFWGQNVFQKDAMDLIRQHIKSGIIDWKNLTDDQKLSTYKRYYADVAQSYVNKRITGINERQAAMDALGATQAEIDARRGEDQAGNKVSWGGQLTRHPLDMGMTTLAGFVPHMPGLGAFGRVGTAVGGRIMGSALAESAPTVAKLTAAGTGATIGMTPFAATGGMSTAGSPVDTLKAYAPTSAPLYNDLQGVNDLLSEGPNGQAIGERVNEAQKHAAVHAAVTLGTGPVAAAATHATSKVVPYVISKTPYVKDVMQTYQPVFRYEKSGYYNQPGSGFLMNRVAYQDVQKPWSLADLFRSPPPMYGAFQHKPITPFVKYVGGPAADLTSNVLGSSAGMSVMEPTSKLLTGEANKITADDFIQGAATGAPFGFMHLNYPFRYRPDQIHPLYMDKDVLTKMAAYYWQNKGVNPVQPIADWDWWFNDPKSPKNSQAYPPKQTVNADVISDVPQ